MFNFSKNSIWGQAIAIRDLYTRQASLRRPTQIEREAQGFARPRAGRRVVDGHADPERTHL